MASISRCVWRWLGLSIGFAASVGCGGVSRGDGQDAGDGQEAGAKEAPAPMKAPIACHDFPADPSDVPRCICGFDSSPSPDGLVSSCTAARSADSVAGAEGVCCPEQGWDPEKGVGVCVCVQVFCKLMGVDPTSCHCDDLPLARQETPIASCPTMPGTVTCGSPDGTSCYGARMECPCEDPPVDGPCEAARLLRCPGWPAPITGCTLDAGAEPAPDLISTSAPTECGSSASSGGSGSGNGSGE
jgi:hypothetical protein